MSAYDSNYPPASHPVRSAFQKDQSFGWLDGAGTATHKPRGGDWTPIGDHSAVGARLFERVNFTTGDPGRSRGRRMKPYGS